MSSKVKLLHRYKFLYTLGDYLKMVKDSFLCLVRTPPTVTSLVHETYNIGFKSFVIVFTAALATGLVMALQFGFGLAKFGGKFYVPKIVAVSIVKELGPIFAALMVAGRVGAGIAAEIGSMKVTQQIDAIRALGTDPLRKIVVPKIIAATIALPMLALIADMTGIFGGVLIAPQLGLSQYDYFFKSFDIINPIDIIGGIIKATVFGFIIGSVGCYIGLNTTGGTQGVGNSTTKSVVACSLCILLFDFVLTKLLLIIEVSLKAGGV